MDKILVLGINGFTGKHFQDFIVKNKLLKGASFVGADKAIEKRIGICYKKIDLSCYKDLEKLILGVAPDYIINFAGIFNSKSFSELENINAGISRNIFEVILRNRLTVKNTLLIGSAAEYGLNSNLPIAEEEKLNPVSPYGVSKVIQTVYANYYLANFGANVNIARTFNVVGRYLSELLSVSSFVEQIRKARNGDKILVGNLNTKRDFLDIADVVNAYWKILMNGKQGQVYNVCRGKSLCIKDILDFLIKRSGKKISIEVKKEYLRKNDILDSYGDNSRLKLDTDWKEEKDIFASLSAMLEE